MARAGLQAMASLVVSAWYGNLDLRHLRCAMLDGGMKTAVVMLLVAASVLMGGLLTRAQIPQQLAESILSNTAQQWAILLILNVFFLHSAAAVILVSPIVIPQITTCSLAQANIWEMSKVNIWFVGLLLAVLMLFTAYLLNAPYQTLRRGLVT